MFSWVLESWRRRRSQQAPNCDTSEESELGEDEEETSEEEEEDASEDEEESAGEETEGETEGAIEDDKAAPVEEDEGNVADGVAHAPSLLVDVDLQKTDLPLYLTSDEIPGFLEKARKALKLSCRGRECPACGAILLTDLRKVCRECSACMSCGMGNVDIGHFCAGQNLSDLAGISIGIQIGIGGRCKVFNGYSLSGEEFALKAYDLYFGDKFDDLLIREVQTLASFNHVNLLKIHGIFISHTVCLIVTPLGLCSALAYAEMHERRCSLGWIYIVYAMARDTAAGLSALHAKGYTHRDLKGENIFTFQDRFVIGDFGSCTTVKDRGRTESIGGTLPYMDKLTIRTGTCSKASDVWSFGVTLCEFAGGETVATQARQDELDGGNFFHGVEERFKGEERRLWNLLKDMLSRCLRPGESDRPTIEKIRKHPFFRACEAKLRCETEDDDEKPMDLSKIEWRLSKIYDIKRGGVSKGSQLILEPIGEAHSGAPHGLPTTLRNVLANLKVRRCVLEYLRLHPMCRAMRTSRWLRDAMMPFMSGPSIPPNALCVEFSETGSCALEAFCPDGHNSNRRMITRRGIRGFNNVEFCEDPFNCPNAQTHDRLHFCEEFYTKRGPCLTRSKFCIQVHDARLSQL